MHYANICLALVNHNVLEIKRLAISDCKAVPDLLCTMQAVGSSNVNQADANQNAQAAGNGASAANSLSVAQSNGNRHNAAPRLQWITAVCTIHHFHIIMFLKLFDLSWFDLSFL